MSAILGVPRIKNMRLLYHPEGSVSTSDAKFSKIFVFQGVYGVIISYHVHRIHHRGKHHGKNTANGDRNTVPRDVKFGRICVAHCSPYQICHRECRGKSPFKPAYTLTCALEIHHAAKTSACKPHRFEHCKLTAAQKDIR